MNLNKIIKIYFAFVMTVSSVALMSYNDSVKQYMASVFYLNDESAQEVSFLPLDLVENFLPNNFSFDRIEYIPPFDFELVNDAGNAFALPGNEGVEIMKFQIKTDDKNFELDDLRLKVEGVDIGKIKEAIFMNNEGIVVRGKKENEHFIFNGIGFELEKESEGSLSLILNLSDDLHPGKRIRMDIEKSEDIGILVDNDPYTLRFDYPIRGKYLSIVKRR